jgi:peptide/nickel transport system ATP-binding protein
MAENLLELRGVSMVFGAGEKRTVALDDYSLAIPASSASVVTIAGESGSGKTTLARLVLGFARPTAGEMLYQGRNIWAMARSEWQSYRREVQAIFQDPFAVYNPFYTVDRLLLSPMKSFGLARNRAEALPQIEDALAQVGLRAADVLGRYPHQLSGGQRQRLTVARCLLLKPRLIVADEPVSMIDASLRATILDALRKLKEEHGISLVYITHDLATAYQISERMEILYRGQAVETGDATAIIQAPTHPYTQLLIDSIPIADPEQTWDTEVAIPTDEAGGGNMRDGCLFRWRCPHAMQICAAERPPLYAVGENRRSACYLHKDQPSTTLEGK